MISEGRRRLLQELTAPPNPPPPAPILCRSAVSSTLCLTPSIKCAPSTSRVQLLAHGSARAGGGGGVKAVPLTQRAVIVSVHRAPCQREGEVKKFRRGRGPQVPSLKPGGGVEGRKIRERQVDALRGREGGSSSPLSCEDGQMRASAHFYDSITANGLKQDKEASGTPRPLTEKVL